MVRFTSPVTPTHAPRHARQSNTMTLENAAYVRAVGQIELVFTFIASYFFFRERSTALELGGILRVVAGIVILLLA